MACYLWITGDFDPKPLLARTDWEADSWQKGDPSRSGEPFQQSGIHICVSDAGFDRLDDQIADAREFLSSESSALAIVESPGVKNAVLVFGVAQHNQPSFGYTFPAELLSLAGRHSIDIQVSLYAVSNLFGVK
jgi:hypothetical protein